MTGGKVRQYPYFVGLFQPSTPLRSVELSKKWRNSGFHGQCWTWLPFWGFGPQIWSQIGVLLTLVRNILSNLNYFPVLRVANVTKKKQKSSNATPMPLDHLPPPSPPPLQPLIPAYTLFQNGDDFVILLYLCCLALDDSIPARNVFEFSRSIQASRAN